MIQKVSIPVWTVEQPSTMQINVDETRVFPLLVIDKGSYIVNAQIESGINFDWEAGVHNLQI